MDIHTVCCTLLVLTCTGLCFGQQLLLPEKINKKVGEDVVITPTRIPDGPYRFITWKFNSAEILFGTPNGITINPPYTDRVTLNISTLALELRTLTESDSGQYSLSVTTPADILTNETSLQVFVPVSNVTIVPSKTELVELNSTVSLVCSASGSSLSFIWLNGSSEVTAGERVQLTDSNSNLTITSVIRGDTGPYQCEASNFVSSLMSPNLTLTIYYGPENVSVEADPVKPIYISGSNLILTCSAVSSPAAVFQWAVNGTVLGEMGQELKLSNIQSGQSGSYTCIAHNKKSLRYSTSEAISITVLVPASNVIIDPSKKEVELNSTVSLVCSASGSSLSFIWLNGSSKVTAGERVQLTDSNSTLTITSVIREDTGPYQCEASNIVSKAMSSPFNLTIIEHVSEGSLSAGAIAGIVIGVLLGVAAVAGLIFYFVKGKTMLRTTSRGNGATPNQGQHDLQHADVKNVQSNQKQQEISAIPNTQAPSNGPRQELQYADVSHVWRNQKQQEISAIPNTQAPSNGPRQTATSNSGTQVIYAAVRNK